MLLEASGCSIIVSHFLVTDSVVAYEYPDNLILRSLSGTRAWLAVSILKSPYRIQDSLYTIGSFWSILETGRESAHHLDVDGVVVLAEEDLDLMRQDLRELFHDQADVAQGNVLDLGLPGEQRHLAAKQILPLS